MPLITALESWHFPIINYPIRRYFFNQDDQLNPVFYRSFAFFPETAVIVFFVRGKGIKTQRGTGDLYIETVVEIPTKLSKAQKQALDALDDNTEIKQCPKMKQYSDNMQSMYGKDPY